MSDLEALTRAIDAVTSTPGGPARHARGLASAVTVLIAHGRMEEARRAAESIPKLAPSLWLDAQVQLGLASHDSAALVAVVEAFIAAPPITMGTGRSGDELAAMLEVLPRFTDVPDHPALDRLIAAMCRWAAAGQRQSEPVFFEKTLRAAIDTCTVLDRGTAGLDRGVAGSWRAHAQRLREALLSPEEHAPITPTSATPPELPSIDSVLALLAPRAKPVDPFEGVLAPWKAGGADAATLLAILRGDPTPDEHYAIRTPRGVFRDVVALDEGSIREALDVVVARGFVIKSADVLVPHDPTAALDARGYDDADAHAIGALLAPWAARLRGDVAERIVAALLTDVLHRGPPANPRDPSHSEWRSHDHRLFEACAALDARALLDPRWLDDLPETSRWVRWAHAGSAGLDVPTMRAQWGDPPPAICVVIVHRLARAERFEDALLIARVEDPYSRQALGHRRVPTSHDTLLTLARSADAITPARAKVLLAAMKKAKRFRTNDALRMHRECSSLLETILGERGAT